MSGAKKQPTPDARQVLYKGVINAGHRLGLNNSDISEVIGKSRTALARSGSIEPDSKTGELAMMLIRCYRSLYALVGGNPDQINHWMQTYNNHTQGIPKDQLKTVQGLTEVMLYLDAMRGRG